MASLVVNQGLQIIGQRASNVNGPPGEIIAIALDGGTAVSNSFLATHTALSDGYGGTSFATLAATPGTSAQTVSHIINFGTNLANFTIGRISLHNSNVPTLSSASLVCGIDQQSIVKTSNYVMQVEVDLTYG